MSNSLGPDQDRCCVGPDLGPSYLQMLSSMKKVAVGKDRVKRLLEWVVTIRKVITLSRKVFLTIEL